jgi:hypothetical protein
VITYVFPPIPADKVAGPPFRDGGRTSYHRPPFSPVTEFENVIPFPPSVTVMLGSMILSPSMQYPAPV